MESSDYRPTSGTAEKVAAELRRRGFELDVVELPKSTHTAVDAAAAVGCDVGEIAKSLVFRTATGLPVLVIASGVNRVDETRVGELLGEEISRADPDFVRARRDGRLAGTAARPRQDQPGCADLVVACRQDPASMYGCVGCGEMRGRIKPPPTLAPRVRDV